jgi:DNA-binding XRE family transcriptional regulator
MCSTLAGLNPVRELDALCAFDLGRNPPPYPATSNRVACGRLCGSAPNSGCTRDFALLVGQTFQGFAWVLVRVPTRPSQNDPKRVAAWEKRRRQVGTRISTLRIDRGYTQEELALRSGVSRNVLIDLEYGRRGILHERLFDIAKALGVSASELLEGIK